MQHHHVVVEVACVERASGEAGLDPVRDGVMVGEVGARMCHQDYGARTAARRPIQDRSRLSAVGRIELHYTLTYGGIDVAEIYRVARMVVGRRRGHRKTPPPSGTDFLPD